MQKKLFLYFCLLSIGGLEAFDLNYALAELNKDLECLSQLIDKGSEQQISDMLAQGLLHDCAFYEIDFPHYRATIFAQLKKLQANPQFLKQKELEKVIAQLPELISTTLTFKEFNKKGKLELFLESFYQAREYTIENISVSIFSEPSQKYLVLYQQCISLLSPLFFDMQLLKTLDIEVIILTILTSQRPLQGNAPGQAQDLSNKCLLQTLRLIGDVLKNPTTETFLSVIRQINWLRINPSFLKSTDMLYVTTENQQKSPIWRVTPPLLTLVAWPKEVLTKSFKASMFTQILEQSIGKHYFGGTSAFQQALDTNKTNDLKDVIQQLSIAIGQQL